MNNTSPKKEIRAPLLRHMYEYVQSKGVTREQLYKDLDISPGQLRQEHRWVEKKTMDLLMNRAASLVTEPDFFFEVGLFSVRQESKGIKGKLMRLTGTVELAYHEVAVLSVLYNRVYDIRVLKSANRSAQISVTVSAPHKISYENCRYLQGMLAAIPEIFNKGLAKIEHYECAVTSDTLKKQQISPDIRYNTPQCLYKFSW